MAFRFASQLQRLFRDHLEQRQHAIRVGVFRHSFQGDLAVRNGTAAQHGAAAPLTDLIHHGETSAGDFIQHLPGEPLD